MIVMQELRTITILLKRFKKIPRTHDINVGESTDTAGIKMATIYWLLALYL